MATTFVIACPECSKQVKVSEEHVGKKVRCKGCGEIFAIKAPEGVASAPKTKAAPAGPAKARATQAAPPTPAPPPPKTPAPDEDYDPNKYTPAEEMDTLPRCPFCAQQLPSHEARICLHCGYDTVKRGRPEVKQIYAPTFGEIFLWLLPAILCIFFLIGVVVWYYFFWDLIVDWLDDSWFEDEKGPPKTYLAAASPSFFRLYHALFIIFMSVPIIRFIYKRLFVNNLPPEKKIKEDLF
jgi:DNA-directed RNA polymerase subunit RPC12/RpoP